MNTNGWIKLHRKLLDGPILKSPNLLHVWIYCLLKANHKEKKIIFNNKEITLKPGQFIFGKKIASMEMNIPYSTLNYQLVTLKNCLNIERQSNNKFSIITILNWGTYQSAEDEVESLDCTPDVSQMNARCTPDVSQSTQEKNGKKEKKVKKGRKEPPCAKNAHGGGSEIKEEAVKGPKTLIIQPVIEDSAENTAKTIDFDSILEESIKNVENSSKPQENKQDFVEECLQIFYDVTSASNKDFIFIELSDSYLPETKGKFGRMLGTLKDNLRKSFEIVHPDLIGKFDTERFFQYFKSFLVFLVEKDETGNVRDYGLHKNPCIGVLSKNIKKYNAIWIQYCKDRRVELDYEEELNNRKNTQNEIEIVIGE